MSSSAIGDYIHLTRMGYTREAKVKNPRGVFFENASQAITKREEQLERWMQETQNVSVANYEKELNSVLGLFKAKKNNSGVLTKEEEAIVKHYLDRSFSYMVKEAIKVDKEEAVKGGILEKSGYMRGSNIGRSKNTRDLKPTDIQSAAASRVKDEIGERIEKALNEIYTDVVAVVGKGQMAEREISSLINNSRKSLIDTIKSINFYAKSQCISDEEKELSQQIQKLLENISISLSSNDAFKDFEQMGGFQKLGEIARILTASTNFREYKGEYGESIVAALTETETILVNGEFGNAIKEIEKVGDKAFDMGLNLRKFGSNLKLADYYPFITSKSTPDGDLLIQANSVKGKADVKITYLNNSKPVTISVKNYSFNSINSGITNKAKYFLNLIQNEEPDFMNHYLNLNATRYKSRQGNEINKSRDRINNILRKIIVAKLIAGYNMTATGRNLIDNVDLFVVIDSTNYTATVTTMGDLLEATFTSGRYKNINVPIKFSRKNIKQEDPRNINIRISNLMKQIAINKKPITYTTTKADLDNAGKVSRQRG